jgi:hypothetical protein
MLFRRALFYWQFTAALLLPVWVVVGRGLYGSSNGWDILLFIVLSIVLGVALLAVAGLTTARKSVRSTRSVSVRDAIILSVWHVAIVAYGFNDFALLAAVIILLTVIAFWQAVIALFTETRDRVRSAFALPEFPVDAGTYTSTRVTDQGDHRVIVIEPGREPRER